MGKLNQNDWQSDKVTTNVRKDITKMLTIDFILRGQVPQNHCAGRHRVQ